ncbi:MAG: DNA gyrase subunit A [Eubacteriales bacterium]
MNSASNKIIPIDIEHEMKKSFISYAMAVIINRALPDVRDGLKPVHRRILYSMNELSLTPDKPHRKCARIVGDVLGKYHPHGDSAVYDALVRMAQDFSIRHMLVDGHGNFGSVDGDGAAAMRYTEARLSKISMEMLRDIDKDTVDYYPNFDETLMQPVCLPSRYPNLLVNGSGGIAVGMATNIPPHNLGETIDACIALLDDEDLSISQIIEKLPGPDFPTGGIIMGKSGINSAYLTGRGRIVVRGRATIESGEGRDRIIITELPYQVNKANLVEKIADLVHDKKVDGIADLRDESDKNGMRIVIEVKRDGNANVILNRLYKHTQLQDTFGVIMISLVNGEPKVLNIKQMLAYYLEHQKDVIRRRTQFELEKAKARAHILEGLIIALDNIDEVIALIKGSPDAATAKQGLCERFALSEKQAQAILDMRLQRLTGLERDKITAEYEELKKRIEHLELILATPQMVSDIIKKEMLEIRDKYLDPRRTEISIDETEINFEELIAEEEMVVTISHFGYIKRTKSDIYKTQRRGGRGISAMTTREEDFAENVFVTSTHSEVLFFTSKGKVYRIKCYQIPEAGRQAKGLAIVNLLPLEQGEKVQAAFPVESYEEGDLLIATKKGFIKKTHVKAYANIRQNGLLAVGLREDDELIGVMKTTKDDNVIIGTKNGISIAFSVSDVRAMGRGAMGVTAISLKNGDEVVDACVVSPDKDVLVITENGYGKRTRATEYKIQRRGGVGIKTIKVTGKTGKLVGLKVVDENDEIMIINDAGIIIRTSVKEISLFGRDTQGVKLMRLYEQSKVACIAKIPPNEDEDLEEEAEQE